MRATHRPSHPADWADQRLSATSFIRRAHWAVLFRAKGLDPCRCAAETGVSDYSRRPRNRLPIIETAVQRATDRRGIEADEQMRWRPDPRVVDLGQE
jgi:hypothetical protein